MKGKITSLVLVGGAFAVGILTQDGSLRLMSGSRALTALIVIAWFGIMGAGLYFWANYTRQRASQHETAPAQGDENSSLRQLAQAIGLKRTVPTAEAADPEKASSQETTQKSSH